MSEPKVIVRYAVKTHDEWFGWHLLEGYSDNLDYVIRLARVRREMGDTVKVVRKTEEITEMEVDWDAESDVQQQDG